MRRFTKGIIAAAALNILISGGAAYAAPSDAGRDLQRTREQIEMYNIEKQIAEDRARAKTKVEVQTPDTQKEPDTAETFHLTRLETDPSKVLTREEIGSVLDKYANSEISVKGLFKAVNELNSLYVKKGYANCRAVLQKQVIEQGIVKLTLIEAVTDDVKVVNNRTTRSSYIKKRIHLAMGEVANLNTLNKELLRFNATNDTQLKVVMQPGRAVGSTEYVIQAFEPQQYTTTVFTDNTGNYNSGVYRQGAFFTVKSLNGERDALTVGTIHSKGSDAVTALYNAPIGHSGTKLNLSYNTNSVKTIKGDYADSVKGHSNAYSIGITQPWITTDKIRSEATLEYGHQTSNTDFTAAPGESYKWVDDTMDDVTASFSMINYGKSHLFYQKHGFVRGYIKSGLYSSNNDNYGFYKFNGMYQKLYKGGQVLSARAEAQLAGGETLPSARQYYVGGANSVRGYKESLIYGASGYCFNLEYQVPFKDKKSSAFLFYDYGSVHGEPDLDDHTLASVGFGFRTNPRKNVGASLTFGFPLLKDINSEEISKMRTHFVVSGQF